MGFILLVFLRDFRDYLVQITHFKVEKIKALKGYWLRPPCKLGGMQKLESRALTSVKYVLHT